MFHLKKALLYITSSLPYERFQGVAALYAFCRYADDTVDSDPLGQEKKTTLGKLFQLEIELGHAYTTNSFVVCPEDKLWWLAFEDTVRRFSIPIDSFLRQLEGQRIDADFRDIKTIDELIKYCELVAGSVGTMMLPLLAANGVDTENKGFIKACEGLGVGMQITMLPILNLKALLSILTKEHLKDPYQRNSLCFGRVLPSLLNFTKFFVDWNGYVALCY